MLCQVLYISKLVLFISKQSVLVHYICSNVFQTLLFVILVPRTALHALNWDGWQMSLLATRLSCYAQVQALQGKVSLHMAEAAVTHKQLSALEQQVFYHP